MIKAIAYALLFFGLPAFSQQQNKSIVIPYYGEAFYTQIRSGLSNQDLKNALRSILSSDHRFIQGRMDEITPSCHGQGCYRFVSLGYDRARAFLLGALYLVQERSGYGVREVYCAKTYSSGEFGHLRPGPNSIPNSNVVNTEHTWPQSRFSTKYPNGDQKADLHHLYPTDSQMNSTRSSFEFGEVVRPMNVSMKCDTAQLGQSARGIVVFEPPEEHKGNVARAIFYFSTRYELPVRPEEEATLRAWNKMDPVDHDEFERNNAIFKVQGTRNPFIDYPELADRINDF
jgi:deoxyribonuclease I